MAPKAKPAPVAEPEQEEDEELEDMSEAEKAKDPLHLARIKREVGGQTFTGVVEDMEIGKITREVLYRIRYADGDLEHFTKGQVEMYLDKTAEKATKKKPAAAPAEEEEEEEEEEETVQELKPVGGLPQASHPNGAMVFAVPATSPEEAMRQLAAASGQAEVPADWSIVATSAQPLRWDPLALGAQWVPELRPQQAPAAHLERCWRTPSQPSTAAGTETPQSNWETSSQATSMDHWQPEQSRPSPGQFRSALRWTAKDADQQIKELKRNDSRQEALARVQDSAWPMALSRHGCHIVQAALDVADKPRRLSMADAFRGRVREALKSPHANHVLQRCVAVLPPENVQFVVAEMEGFAREIARHPFGCRVLERLIEHCPRGQTERLAQEVIADVLELSRHPYGNYVVQHLLEHGTAEHRQGITRNLLPSARGLARHKIASNVVEKALTYCDDEMRQKLKQRMFSSPEELASLEHSNYGSFVVKELKRR